jgi:hypothetical protein
MFYYLKCIEFFLPPVYKGLIKEDILLDFKHIVLTILRPTVALLTTNGCGVSVVSLIQLRNFFTLP